MEPFAVSVMPIAKFDEWRTFAGEIESGDRADAHREMLRRLGVKREHIRVQPSPAGHLVVLVWEGVDQERVGELMGDMLQNPPLRPRAVRRRARGSEPARDRPVCRASADDGEGRHD
jgi:hypothetical protein